LDIRLQFELRDQVILKAHQFNMHQLVLIAILACVCGSLAAPQIQVQDVQVDASQNVVTVRYPGEDGSEGLAVVVDYDKSVIGVHDAAARRCYLVGGVPSSAPSASELVQALKEGSDLMDPTENLYRVSDASLPIKGGALLPSPLQGPCADLPTSWMEQSGSSDVPQAAPARVCVRICVAFFCYTHCF
jgi:hypothetical protein